MRPKFYVTTSIPYVNDRPHVGFALELIQADFLARYQRQRGRDVFFLTGADEHGIKIVKSAAAAGKSPRLFVNEIARAFKGLKRPLNLSWDYFIRTSDRKNHWPGVWKLWRLLERQGDLYRRTYEGLYCVGHEAFVTPKELVNGLCPEHKTKPEFIKEENFFFRLSKYAPAIEKAIRQGKIEIRPRRRQNEALSLLRQGLTDISFSRPRQKVPWGIPVPGHPEETIYVWGDALSNYLSAIGYGRDERKFRKWWPAEVQLIGKDIWRFHILIWPALLLAAGLPLPRRIYIHGFVKVEGEKMSKSLGNIVDPYEAVRRYGTDPFRYFLLRRIPSDEDGDFSYQKLESCYQADLANGLGNFAARVLALAASAGELPKTVVEREVVAAIRQTKKAVEHQVADFKLHEAVAATWKLIGYGDGYINRHEIWHTKEKKKLFNLIVLLDNIAALVYPVMPLTSEKITKSIKWTSARTIKVKKIKPLFPRLS